MSVFRKQYRELALEEKARVDEIKNRAEALYELLTPINPGQGARELALARTKLEECVMWATKGLT